MANDEPIAVIGMACRFPGGADSPSKLWDLLQSPRHLSTRVPSDRFDITGFHHTNGSHHGATDATNAYFLEEDVTKFDNSFFNIQPAEAEAIDPQQRLLMETVYDSLCAGGQQVENLRGSNTAVFVGLMCDDWSQLLSRDWDLMPTYAATGESRAVMSNRISYFFDWHGPSMTVDTACSSSLVAVHQGVTAIRNGECSIAIAAGANLILSPGMMIAESSLHMLSPTGTSKMWDSAADGYARGEGIAAVVLKPLSAALRDGDHIDCIVRGTAVNQDGKTTGLTMPSNIAQTALIRDTYARAGLDIHDPKDRPQFFHAHGTGTPAGDPQEAEAISRSFFKDGQKAEEKLHVGSIKTVIGHTEGSAGLASLIGSVMAMQKGIIPPNLHFQTVSARVAPFYTNLQVPTKATPWPEPLPGQPRRASVNSFGFGGTNAHAILEYYEPKEPKQQAKLAALAAPLPTPLTISAGSPATLTAMLADLSAYLKANPTTSIEDLAYTLQMRRSTLSHRAVIVASSASQAIDKIDGLLADAASNKALSTRRHDVAKPSILGVFTGQGAQWARMGARLIEESPFAAQRIAELQRALATLPSGDRPTWALSAMLRADQASSRLGEAAIAQPLCTAVQIVLIDLIRAADIKLRAVVGHSSGEIGAAYAAGFLSAEDAIRVAYYRGLYAKLAGSPSGEPGAMMAVGTSFEDAKEFCQLDDFVGRIQIAARNSSTSMTLSGDLDAIEEAMEVFQAEGKFARQLKVDTAYHSTHMLPCAAPYIAGLARAGYSVAEGNGTEWLSSVKEGSPVMTKADVEDPQYWVDNMTSAVLFAPAINAAVAKVGNFDMAIEFGPHPALKGPALDTIEEAMGNKIPYTGLLARGKDDGVELANAVGMIWTTLGASSVKFDAFSKKLLDTFGPKPQLLTHLPTYPFDRTRSFSALTRFSGAPRMIHDAPNPILGRRLVETEATDGISWRNVLRPSEIKWLSGHGLQGQTVFPAMGYVSMAVEAAAIAAGDRPLGLVTLQDIVIGRAIAFANENIGVETKVSLQIEQDAGDELTAVITCHSGLPFDQAPFVLNFKATLRIGLHEPSHDTLPASRLDEQLNLVSAAPDRLYSQLSNLGYSYNPPFTGIREIERKLGWARGDIDDEAEQGWENQLLVHPGWLDSAVQTGFAAYSHPHDNRFFNLLVPTAIQSMTINPFFCDKTSTARRRMHFQTSARVGEDSPMLVDIDIFAGNEPEHQHPFVQFETLKVMPFAAATARDDAVVFSRFNYRSAGPNAYLVTDGDDQTVTTETTAQDKALDRVGFYYLRRLYQTITVAETEAALPHFKSLLDYAKRMIDLTARGQCAAIPRESLNDSSAFIRALINKYRACADMQLSQAVGDNLINVVRSGESILEHMTKDGLLDRFYAEGSGVKLANTWVARIVSQISHRHPHMNILEVGAGTGAASRRVLEELGNTFDSYTFTDVDTEVVARAQEAFSRSTNADRMAFAVFDIEMPADEQGFTSGVYDVVIASNVLHTAGDLDNTMAHIRSLLRPGGYLVAVEAVSQHTVSMNMMLGGLPNWWKGAAADPTRQDGPCLNLDEWDAVASRSGFDGIDSHVPVANPEQKYSAFVCQAIDDRVSNLRAPLSSSTTAEGNLVVVGGRTAASSDIAQQAISLLESRYSSVAHVAHLEDLIDRGLAPDSSVLSLTELDEQFLEVRTEAKLNALKVLWRGAKNVLWVSRGSRDERPYSSIMIGLGRVVRVEYPNVNVQLLDFDSATEMTPELVAEALVRLELSGIYSKQSDSQSSLLWTHETEAHYVNGQLTIPRLIADEEPNRRYNTYRRAIRQDVLLEKSTVAIESASNGKDFELAVVSPLRQPPPAPTPGAMMTLQIEQSLLHAIKIHDAGYLSLVVGKDVSTGSRFAALGSTSVESTMQVPAQWTARVPDSLTSDAIASCIIASGASLIAQSIIAAAPRFGTLLVHDANDLLIDVLAKESMQEGVRIAFTTSSKELLAANSLHARLFIHDKLPIRQARNVLPSDASCLVNFAAPDSKSSKLIHRLVGTNMPTFTASSFVHHQPNFSPSANINELSAHLTNTWQAVLKKQRVASSATQKRDKESIIPLADVAGALATDTSLRVVDWTTASSVKALVRPIDHGDIFRANATYLLVGLTGDLGQSLCTWMVDHGARHIVLSSRRPKVNPKFIAELAAKGAHINVIAMDATRRDSLRAAYDKIRAEMPPIAGVANGAMLLEDSLFDDLEFASLERTSPPKIEASVLLDELFYDTPLDFFILLTSTSQVAGNGGQSAYVMANQFMNALGAQRRDVRGVVGSNMAISFVVGIGYFEHAEHLDKDYFVRLSYRGISERDLHELFAETILAGQPGNAGVSEVASGIAPFRNGPETHAFVLTNPKFSHLMINDVGSAQGLQGGANGGGGKSERPRNRLASAATMAEAQEIVREAFVERLKRILMIPQGDSMDEKSTFIEQGIDSIMAVEVRSWVLQELDVDMPVLKILGADSTVEALLVDMMKNIPKSIFDPENMGKNAKAASSAPAAAPKSSALPPPLPKVSAPTTKKPTSPVTPPVKKAATTSPSSPSPAVSTASPASSFNGGTPRGASTAQSEADTPLETPLEKSDLVLADDAQRKQKIIRALEKQQEDDRRKRIIASSTEIIEPMNSGQKRFWFLHHYIEDPTTFGMTYQFRLQGHIRVPDLAKAVEVVAKRHEALRTRYFWSEDGTKTPMQGILSQSFVRLETANVASEQDIVAAFDELRNHAWDLSTWGQLRLRLLSLSDKVHYLVMGAHHISMDGHSVNMLMYDINNAYTRGSGRPLPVLPEASQARSFGKTQDLLYSTGKLQPSLDFFRRTLSKVDLSRPIDLFPFARTSVRSPLVRYNNNISKIRLDPETAARMKQLARLNKSTPFHGYLNAFRTLIFQLLPADAPDNIVIGIADANRTDSKFMGSLGNFLNALPLGVERALPSQSFGAGISQIRDSIYAALQHSGVPFDVLLDELAVPRSNTYPPVCQLFIDYKLVTREQADMRWVGCNVSGHEWQTSRSTYDVGLEIVEDHESALVVFHTQDSLYSKETTDLLLRTYVNLLEQVVRQPGEQVLVSKLDSWSAKDVNKAIELGTGPTMQLNWPATVSHHIDQVMAENPNSMAVVDGDGRTLTYAQLNNRIETIAQGLLDKLPDQSKTQSVVGVFQSPGTDWMASLLAILRVGAVYLPLDLKASVARLHGFVKAAKPAVILVDQTTQSLTQDLKADDSAQLINLSSLPTANHTSWTVSASQAARPAYMIFTSGSTGIPKGVVIKHASLRALAEGYIREWDIATHGRAVLQQFPLTSDASMKQILSAFGTGGCLVVASANQRGDPTELTRLMVDHKVTFAVATPSEWSMWFRFASDNLRNCTTLTSAWFGGERTPQSLIDSFRELRKTNNNLRVFHSYGPTEATISTVKAEVNLNDAKLALPIPSYTLPNYAVYIVNDQMRPVPLGVPGQILIGGRGVGENEYLNQPEVTAKAFIPDVFASQDTLGLPGWGRVYCTGDYGRLNNQGLLTIEGRVAGDSQVKVRGFRVELGEIEGVIMKEAAGSLAAAVVTLRPGEGDHDGLLVAHVVVSEQHRKTDTAVKSVVDNVRDRIVLALPQYMVPAVIVPLDELPLITIGKVDRKALQAMPLPELLVTNGQSSGAKQPLTSAEQSLADIWATVLPQHAAAHLTSESDFFLSGGNSLLLVKLQDTIKRRLGDAPRLSNLMSSPTLGSMSKLLEAASSSGPDWDEDMMADDLVLVNPSSSVKNGSSGLHVLITGATGSLGKHLVPHLVKDDRVTRLTILARPAQGRNLDSLFSKLGSKIRVVATELPALPTDAEIGDVNVILHAAADRNFWDGYSAVKPVNVDSVKALAQLATRTGATLHVMSSGALSNYRSDNDDQLPQPDAGDGYVASKWVAERYLSDAARRFDLPVSAHRPTKAAAPTDANAPMTQTEEDMVQSILDNAPRLGVRPDFSRIGGPMDVALVDEVAASIVAAALNNQRSASRALDIINYPADSSVRSEAIATKVAALMALPQHRATSLLPAVPVLHWVGQAKRAGLFPWIFSAQELVVTDEQGQQAISRR